MCTYDFNHDFLEGFGVLALENGTEATLGKTALNYESVIDDRLDHIGLIFKDEGDVFMVLTRSINQFLLIHSIVDKLTLIYLLLIRDKLYRDC
jgi:hypothetical protein